MSERIKYELTYMISDSVYSSAVLALCAAAPLANQAQVLQDLCVIPIRKWRGNLPTSLGQLSREAQELYASAIGPGQVWPAQWIGYIQGPAGRPSKEVSVVEK
ncbi:hypothetical protein GLOTRDRAFT_133875 [Gloeophyllum trabeum ATCC 11539]|uniref:Uncharacterized protein n=1 Tax=Gloeophyllum trabeum (strain ATCC 11539 / FP-39264 / Madison 617) TaxID=670483 RepID=S7PT67_GLOTA|nr:uncharacterized protein GLOTRDRAFT_133875 [Gloeophyllum trabeum ATCC 11539]EPQ50502.1 hypothetical protein GLOTRDRAFT_133875 [Gloeophyllum trabeum ATCC 11539]